MAETAFSALTLLVGRQTGIRPEKVSYEVLAGMSSPYFFVGLRFQLQPLKNQDSNSNSGLKIRLRLQDVMRDILQDDFRENPNYSNNWSTTVYIVQAMQVVRYDDRKNCRLAETT